MTRPSFEATASYLNDHLAGSVAALALIDDLLATPSFAEHRKEMTQLRCEIEQDQKMLKIILKEIGAEQNGIKSAVAWCSEKLTRLKLHLGKIQDSKFAIFEALEILVLGIHGKWLMWSVLENNGIEHLLPPNATFEALKLEAIRQGRTVESWRLAYGNEVIGGNTRV